VQPEAANRRKTDIAMAKITRTRDKQWSFIVYPK